MLITRKDRNLIINSQVIKDLPWLKEIIDSNNSISEDFASSLPEEQRLYLYTMIDRLRTQAAIEWRKDSKYPFEDRGPDMENWLSCELCGTPNRYIFYITNQLSGISMNVGRECVQEFDFGVNARQVMREQQRLSRIAILNVRYKNIARIVEAGTKFLDSTPIIVPSRLTDPLNKIHKELTHQYEKFISNKEAEAVSDSIGILLGEREKAIQMVDKYVKRHITDKFIATREIYNWLRFKGDKVAITRVSETGLVSEYIINRIRERKFLDRIKNDVARTFRTAGFELLSVDYDREGYLIEHKTHPGIKLFCPHDAFAFRHSNQIMEGQGTANYDAIVLISSITGDSSIQAFIDELNQKLIVFKISVIGFFVEENEAIVNSRREMVSEYAVVDLKDLVGQYKTIALSGISDGLTISKLLTQLKTAKWYTREQILGLDIARYRDAV